MSQTTISIRMDEGLKSKFSRFCENVGINMSTAVCMFAKDTVRNQSLPFEVTTRKRKLQDPFWSEANQTRLSDSIKEMQETGGTPHSIEEMYAHLDQ